MSTGKRIGMVCSIITVLAAIITAFVLYTGKASVLVVDADAKQQMFDEADLTIADFEKAKRIELSGTKDVYITRSGNYILSGSLDNASIIVEADKSDKVNLLFDNVSVTNTGAPAFLVENAGKVIVTLAENSENELTMLGKLSDKKADGTMYCKDDLTINGSGYLDILSEKGHGIVCNDTFVLSGGRLRIQASKDGIHANDAVKVCSTELSIQAGDDGITVSNDDETAFFYIDSGTIEIPACYEGLEAVRVIIDGGEIAIYSRDDGINATGNRNGLVQINRGNVTVLNTGGRDVDGIDSNKDIEINGGVVFISVNEDGASCCLDYGKENGGELKINGGTVIACGSTSMQESVSNSSQQGFIEASLSKCAAGTAISVKDAEENIIINNATVANSFSAVIISSEKIENGKAYHVITENGEKEVIAGETAFRGGFGAGGPGWGRMERSGNRPDMPKMPKPPQT